MKSMCCIFSLPFSKKIKKKKNCFYYYFCLALLAVLWFRSSSFPFGSAGVAECWLPLQLTRSCVQGEEEEKKNTNKTHRRERERERERKDERREEKGGKQLTQFRLLAPPLSKKTTTTTSNVGFVLFFAYLAFRLYQLVLPEFDSISVAPPVHAKTSPALCC